ELRRRKYDTVSLDEEPEDDEIYLPIASTDTPPDEVTHYLLLQLEVQQAYGKAARIAATGVDYVLRGKSIVSGDRRNFGNQRGNGEISYSLRQTRITRNAASGDA